MMMSVVFALKASVIVNQKQDQATKIKNMKFNIQDRIVLDEMVDTFTAEMNKTHDEAELMDKRPIITREYWLQMIKEVQRKIDDFTTVKALNQSRKYR